MAGIPALRDSSGSAAQPAGGGTSGTTAAGEADATGNTTDAAATDGAADNAAGSGSVDSDSGTGDTGDAGGTGNAVDTTPPIPAIPGRVTPRTPDEIPPIATRHPDRVSGFNKDHTFALVNGEVISASDIEREYEAFFAQYQMLIIAFREGKGWTNQPNPYTQVQAFALYQNFRGRILDILYRQSSEEFRQFFGSVPNSAVQEGVENFMRQSGIDPTTSDADRKLREALAARGMDYLTLQQAIREQVGRQRVYYMLAYHPEYSLGMPLDVTPAEIRAEYQRQLREAPIRSLQNIRIYRVEMPVLAASETTDVFETALGLSQDVTSIFASTPAGEREGRFKTIVSERIPLFSGELEHLDTLDDEDAVVASEIRRTAPGSVSAPIVLEDKIVLVYVVAKEEGEIESLNSPSLQLELRRRIENRLWGNLREKADIRLIEDAVIIPHDIVGE